MKGFFPAIAVTMLGFAATTTLSGAVPPAVKATTSSHPTRVESLAKNTEADLVAHHYYEECVWDAYGNWFCVYY